MSRPEDDKDRIPSDVRTAAIADKIDRFLTDAREDLVIEPKQFKMKKLHSKMGFARNTIIVLLVILCLFTRPPWCTKMGDKIDKNCVNGPDATKYYRSKFPLFSATAIGTTASILMAIVSADQFFIYMAMKGENTKNNRKRKILAFTLLALCLTHILFDIMEQSGAILFRLSEINRSLFLMVSIQTLRISGLRLVGILWRSREIIFLFILNWLFFSAASRVFFQSYKKYYDNPLYYIYNLTNFKDTIFTLYVLLTTANYPDILVKEYGQNRLTFIFFFIYTFMTIFIMINMLVGVFYFNYKQVVTDVLSNAERDKDFAIILRICLQNKVTKMKWIKPLCYEYIKDKELKRFKYKGRPLVRVWGDQAVFFKKKKVKTDKKEKLSNLQKGKFYRFTFGFLGFAAAVGAIILIENKWVTSIVIQVIYLIVATFSALDSFMTLLVSGIKEEAKNFLMWSELFSSIGILFLSSIFFTYKTDDQVPTVLIKLWGCCCMMKFTRLIVYLTTFKQIGLTFEVFFQLIPFLKSFLGMLLIIFFIFATIGGNLFGGRISNKTPNLFKQKTGIELGTNYIYINFNDLPSSILALYVNVINNNWIYFANMFILDENDEILHYRWYFVIFQLITNLFVMTILIGFIIDSILRQFEKMVEEEKKKKDLAKGDQEEAIPLNQRNNSSDEEAEAGEEDLDFNKEEEKPKPTQINQEEATLGDEVVAEAQVSDSEEEEPKEESEEEPAVEVEEEKAEEPKEIEVEEIENPVEESDSDDSNMRPVATPESESESEESEDSSLDNAMVNIPVSAGDVVQNKEGDDDV